MFLVFPVDFCAVFGNKGKENDIAEGESKSKKTNEKHVHCPSEYENAGFTAISQETNKL